MLVTTGYIPASVPKGYFAEIACRWTKPEVQGFGVSLHTHHYDYWNRRFIPDEDQIIIKSLNGQGTWLTFTEFVTELGLYLQVSLHKMEKLVYKHVTPLIGGFVDIKPGDILASKCLYINKSDKPVHFGLRDGEEMCNADVLFGFDPQHEELFKRTGACVTDLPEFSFCNHKETAGICRKTFS